MKNIDRKLKYLKALGVEVWTSKANNNQAEVAVSAVIQDAAAAMSKPANPDVTASATTLAVEVTNVAATKTKPALTEDKLKVWQSLAAAVKNCQLCPLYKTRTQAVFGCGDKQADLLIVGEAPGANEDKQGQPFVGRGGMLLTSMLKAIDLEREQVYITNILKSRPPNNRDPLPEEVKSCTPYLKEQIELLQPKLIVAVGRIAAHFLLNTDDAMARLRGHTYSYDYGKAQVPLLVTYHPAYLLRSPREKRKAYSDMLMIKRMLNKVVQS